MKNDVQAYRYVIYYTMSETDPKKLTEQEFTTAVRVLVDSIEKEVSIGEIPEIFTTKINIVLGLLLDYSDILNNPQLLPPMLLSEEQTTLQDTLRALDDTSSAKSILSQISGMSVNFPINIK